ncbi:DNA gyrase subunit B [Bacillus phage vB_BceM-HSE3]|nr:DNA gyrase subunit B [Bacillus phage vB_BceM-HSE3]
MSEELLSTQEVIDEYGTDEIDALSDIAHIRLRPGMYIGMKDNPKQLFAEILDNSLDEGQNGYSHKTEVYVDTKEKIYQIKDYGRGIPIGLKELKNESGEVIQEIEALELLFTKSNSGGKFSNKGYKIRGGLHGVGNKCVNALSEWMTAETRRSGKKVIFKSEQGRKTDLIYEDMTETDSPGMTVTFKGDDTIFNTVTIPIDFIMTRCKTANSFGYKIELYVDGELQDLGEGTLRDLLPQSSSEDVSEYAELPINATLETGEFVKTFIVYTSDTRDAYKGFTNLLYNSAGGTHIREFQRIVTEAWKPYIQDTIIQPNDVLVGLRSVVAVFISEPEFASQTKEKLSVSRKDLEPLFNELKSEFSNYLNENEPLRKALLKRFEEYRITQNKFLSQKEIQSIVVLNDNATGKGLRRRSVVAKLVECKSKDRDGTELLICEGDSAMGSILAARDPYYQAALPLRGKILNVTHKSIKDALKSEEVRSIVNSVGAGVGPDSNADLSRYEDIIIVTDADPDGANIAALVIAVFVFIIPDIVKQGRLKIALTPLYGYTDPKTKQYIPVFDREDLPKGVEFTRYKGLGEMDPEEFKVCCLLESSRKLLEVTYPNDLEEFSHILSQSWKRFQLLESAGVIQNLRGNNLEMELVEE